MLPAQANVADLRVRLAAAYPQLKPMMSGLLIAVNAQYAGDATLLTSQSDVACFPPVSGG